MWKKRRILLPVFVATAFIFQLATPAVAWADEVTPPPEPPPAEEVSAETPEAPQEESAPVAVEAAEAPQEESAPTAADILAQVPEDTSVLVLDPSGEPEALVTSSAAEAIVTSDPVWCPAGIANPLDATCTTSQPSFSALLTFLNANPSYAGPGTVFFYSAVPMVYSLDDVRISPTAPGAGGLTALTIDGMGHQFTVPIEVTGWAYDVMIANVNMDLSTYGNPAAGLRVETTGAITVNDVDVTESGGGAYLDNDAGSAAITIEDSTFNDNAWTGLDARSAGDIALQAVEATGNEYGAFLDASAGPGDITIDNSMFNGNDAAGLTARTAAGGITLTHVTASNNATNTDAYGAGLTGTAGGAIHVSNSDFFANSGKGLWIEASGSASLQGVGADGNGLHGAYIHNLNACAAVPLPVLIDGGTYSNSGGYGILAVLGPGGTLTFGTMPTFSGNATGDYYEDLSPCPECEKEHEGKPYNMIYVPETGGDPVPLDCETFAGTVLILPNGNRATLVCPLSGEATLEVLPEGGLPGPLPTARTFASGVTVDLAQDGATVQAISEGGYITLAFSIPEDLLDASLAILYWDPLANSGAGGWVELPPYALRPDGSPMIHRLHPDADPGDGMYIRGGVRISGGFAKVSVNFPGSFVLVAR
jgi:hypothetical protein